MARFFPDRVVVAALLIAGALNPAFAASPTVDKKTPIDWKEGEKHCFRADFNAGTLTLCDVTLTQGSTTRITAEHASAKGLSDNNNGEWLLTGTVHIEFNNVILDADSATVVFAQDRLQSVHVKGAPSRFSQQLKDPARRNQGRAATIDYDSQKDVLQLTGDTWYTDGRNVVETAAFTYNLNDGSIFSSERVKGTIQPEKRVPAPRTPDRATSQ
jgi:lipopolysaccharide transport protein LptA